MKKIQRLTVAELKQLVKKPEAVEVRKQATRFSIYTNILLLVVGCNRK
jgi:predicted RNA-binding protein YlqC (UPF0109 family)